MKRLLHVLAGLIFMASISAAEVTKVDVIYPQATQQHQMLTLTGTVEARQNANLAPLQAGVVEKLAVEIGDKVESGQHLLSLDAKLAELSLAQHKASLKASLASQTEAERLYQEVVTLSKKQLVAETLMAERLSALEVAKANFSRAQAALAQQQEVLARHRLYAPFSGVIAERHVDLGEWVTQQSPLFTLVAQSNLRVNLSIPQEYYNQLNQSEAIEVLITHDFAQSVTIAATLDRLVAVANDSSRTITGLVELPENLDLVSGMSVTAQIQLPASDQNIVWLPKSAIKQHPDGGRSVFTVEGSKAKHVLVKVVKQQGNKIAVSGVNAEQGIVVSGVALLKDGDSLTVTRVNGDNL
ncbi:efflux RND transporter periplasmic adaptor subunit [Thalassotalea sp. M1531]|uniref:Efflux RND transporter periplasmic adaptor subunit n=1 Tax=Thalassotalea algicola TaxID=2716224 RepID=A0A7Y0LAV6_9GAMM|nr:efflux RND transporter periplasmic adaptor subunit [Thalassotalea algicola]NMP31155.1 efflux RND transporter periplasmic adaptor subunit [Thalassotalea algicola]